MRYPVAISFPTQPSLLLALPTESSHPLWVPVFDLPEAFVSSLFDSILAVISPDQIEVIINKMTLTNLALLKDRLAEV